MKKTWPWAVGGAVLVWLAQPPLAIAALGWWALVPWGWLIVKPEPLRRGGWWSLYFAGAGYWLVTMQGVRLAHPALYPGWFALAAYLGLFPILSVAVGRLMHRRWRIPVWLGLPISWTGFELIRSHAFTGLSAAMLGHSQADFPWAIQIADLGGTYWVSFTVAMVSGLAVWLSGQCVASRAGSAEAITCKKVVVPVVCVLAVLAASFGYGGWRLSQSAELAEQPPLISVLLIQRNEPLQFTLDPAAETSVFRRYVDSSLRAIAQHPDADLVVWPESMFTAGYPYRIVTKPFTVPPEAMHFEQDRLFTPAEFEAVIEQQRQGFETRAGQLRQLLGQAAGSGTGPELLLGTSVYEYGMGVDSYCAAVHLDGRSRISTWYGKMHLVMFGEYIPFGRYFPWLYEIGPLRQGATPGKRPVSMNIADVEIAPSICFETMVEHATGNGLRRLRTTGKNPQLIVNLTNDAWFHGTAILSHHRRCSQFVAVSNRLPLLIAANQGPTTWIDSSGHRIESLAYETDGWLLAKPTADHRVSMYARLGDRTSWPLSAICVVVGVVGFFQHRQRSKTSTSRFSDRL